MTESPNAKFVPAALLCSVFSLGCASILDISEPTPRDEASSGMSGTNASGGDDVGGRGGDGASSGGRASTAEAGGAGPTRQQGGQAGESMAGSGTNSSAGAISTSGSGGGSGGFAAGGAGGMSAGTFGAGGTNGAGSGGMPGAGTGPSAGDGGAAGVTSGAGAGGGGMAGATSGTGGGGAAGTTSGAGGGGAAGTTSGAGGGGVAGALSGTGGGGSGGEACNVLGEKRCGGPLGKVPEVCDGTFHFKPNPDVNGGNECSRACVRGLCTECDNGQRRCVSDRELFTDTAEECVDGFWDQEFCGSYCSSGACVTPPSCNGRLTCGARNGNNESCCRSLSVPGGSFSRSYDGTNDWPDDSYRATVDGFSLDKFEVTVGRFQNFVNAYPASKPALGSGKHPHIPEDEGWLDSYPLPEDRAALQEQLSQSPCEESTWAAGDQFLPINCVNFAVALAFCIWDGGRLPTEAEWNYAAAGGEQQRVYPWSRFPGDATISPDHAVYDGPGGLPSPVGSKSGLGTARWGHEDLAGNLFEWALDWYIEPYDDNPAYLIPTGARVIRGGSYLSPADNLTASLRLPAEPESIIHIIGFRCARDPAATSNP